MILLVLKKGILNQGPMIRVAVASGDIIQDGSDKAAAVVARCGVGSCSLVDG